MLELTIKTNIKKTFDLFFEVMSRLPIDGPYNKEEISYLVGGFVGMNLKPECPLHEFFAS